MQTSRREWLKKSTVAALGLGLSLRSLANEEGLLRNDPRTAGLLNLGSNENPYGISPKAKEVIRGLIGEANRYQYNVTSVSNFRNELADHYGIHRDQLLITPGSGEGLIRLARYYGQRGNIVTADPTFPTLPAVAESIGAKVIRVPLTTDKVHDLEALQSAITSETSLVYLCNPANPTATMLKHDVIRDFCLEVSKKTAVLIDEAYIDYLTAPDNRSLAYLVADNPNIIVIRTFSKIHAMAGMRIGFTIAHPTLSKALYDSEYQRSMFGCAVPSMGAALTSLKDEAHQDMSREKNAFARTYTYDTLKKMGYLIYPSHTNFLFFKLADYKGDFAADMLNKNIVLRSSDYADGKWCRVSVGTLDEMKKFIAEMRKIS